MNLSFQEKSAWGLLAGILLVSGYYFPAALAVVEQTGHPVPLLLVSIGGVVATKCRNAARNPSCAASSASSS